MCELYLVICETETEIDWNCLELMWKTLGTYFNNVILYIEIVCFYAISVLLFVEKNRSEHKVCVNTKRKMNIFPMIEDIDKNVYIRVLLVNHVQILWCP